MHQLSLMNRVGECTLEEHLRAMRAQWASALGDSAHLDAAVRITSSRFDSWGVRSLDVAERTRVSSYLRAVIRKRILHAADPEAVAARRRLVAASIEADLRSGGWNPGRAADEARRVTGLGLGCVGAA